MTIYRPISTTISAGRGPDWSAQPGPSQSADVCTARPDQTQAQNRHQLQHTGCRWELVKLVEGGLERKIQDFFKLFYLLIYLGLFYLFAHWGSVYWFVGLSVIIS